MHKLRNVSAEIENFSSRINIGPLKIYSPTKKRLTVWAERQGKNPEQYIEQTKKSDRFQHIEMRGIAMSRIEPKKSVSSRKYYDKLVNITWPSGDIKHYVEKHNCAPSLEFYNYIMNWKNKDSQIIQNLFF